MIYFTSPKKWIEITSLCRVIMHFWTEKSSLNAYLMDSYSYSLVFDIIIGLSAQHILHLRYHLLMTVELH